MALEEDIPEQAEDKTIPRYRQIDKRAGRYVVEWGQELEQQYQAWVEEFGHRSHIPSKRGADGRSGAPNKKVKAKDDAVSVGAADVPGEEEMRTRFEKGTIDKLTVAILKEWCQTKGLDGKGKKADLVEKVESYFEPR